MKKIIIIIVIVLVVLGIAAAIYFISRKKKQTGSDQITPKSSPGSSSPLKVIKPSPKAHSVKSDTPEYRNWQTEAKAIYDKQKAAEEAAGPMPLV